jgi:hypothetical protein
VDDDYYKTIFVDVACHHFDSDFVVVLVVVQDKIDHLKKMVDEQVVDYHLLVHYNDYLDDVMFELNAYLMAIVVVNDLVVIVVVVQCYLMQNYQRICFYCLLVESMIYYYPILIEIIKTMVYQLHRHQYEYEIL